jgi:hypothetical protein
MPHGFERGKEHVYRPESCRLEAERDDLVLLRGRARHARPLIGPDPETFDAEAFDNGSRGLAARHQKAPDAFPSELDSKPAEGVLGERRRAFAPVLRLSGEATIFDTASIK